MPFALEKPYEGFPYLVAVHQPELSNGLVAMEWLRLYLRARYQSTADSPAEGFSVQSWHPAGCGFDQALPLLFFAVLPLVFIAFPYHEWNPGNGDK